MIVVTRYSWFNVTTNTPHYLEDREMLNKQRLNAEECINVTPSKVEVRPHMRKIIPKSLRNTVLGKPNLTVSPQGNTGERLAKQFFA